MIVIIPDTNILAASPLLVSPEWQSLIQDSRDVEIIVPDVVVMETVTLVRRTWEVEAKKLDSVRLGAFAVGDHVQAIRDAIRQRIDAYEDDLRARLADIGASIFPVPLANHLDIAKRASLRIPPYQGESKDGYRDTLIWLTVMAAAEDYAEDEIWFVSQNHKDFGPKPGDWTGPNAGSQSDCPILFNSHLAGELQARGISPRVKFVTSLGSLEQHLAALHAPISAEELTKLTASLDFHDMNHFIEEVARATEITPSEAALNPNVLRAFLNRLKVRNIPWEFSDAARRGEERWTASYTVDVEAEIITYRGIEAAAVVTKPLRLSGVITIKEPSQLEGLGVTTVSSLPDDPDRELWEMLRNPGRGQIPGIAELLNNSEPGFTELLRNAGSAQLPGIAELLNDSNSHFSEMLKSAGSVQRPGLAELLNNSGPGFAELLRNAGSAQIPGIAELLKDSNSDFSEILRSAGSPQAHHNVAEAIDALRSEPSSGEQGPSSQEV